MTDPTQDALLFLTVVFLAAILVGYLIGTLAAKHTAKPAPKPVCSMCKGSGVWRSTTGLGRRIVEPCLCGLGRAS